MICNNLDRIRTRIQEAAEYCGRDPQKIRLVAVSKRIPAKAVTEAYHCGQVIFGENYLQDARDKIKQVEPSLQWHFIGHLQTNKARMAAELFQVIETVDRLKIAKRLSRQRPESVEPLNVCIEVNVDGEEKKSGVSPAELPELAVAIAELPRLRLRGLMCLPAIRHDFDEQRKPFAALREMLESLRASGLTLDTLSMGMSADYAAAIHEGATIVRIGTALFGAR